MRHVNLLNCTPSFFESVRGDAPQTTSLKHLVLGGEALSSELQREISRSFEIGQVTNLYGPTETTIDAVGHVVVEPARDVERDPDAAELVMSVNGGNQTVPTVVFPDGTALTNPSLDQVKGQLAA